MTARHLHLILQAYHGAINIRNFPGLPLAQATCVKELMGAGMLESYPNVPGMLRLTAEGKKVVLAAVNGARRRLGKPQLEDEPDNFKRLKDAAKKLKENDNSHLVHELLRAVDLL